MKRLVICALFICGVASADDALDKAIVVKLEHCGLHLSGSYGIDSDYSKITASFGDITLAQTKTEDAATRGLLSWARSNVKDALVRAAYVDILERHLETTSEALEEFATHNWAKQLERYKHDEAYAKSHTAEWASKIPDPPCHSEPRKTGR